MPRFSTLSRRTFLTGTAGTAIALPFLEAMLPRTARAGDDAPPRRFVSWTQPNGTVVDNWVCPEGPGGPTDFELSPILAPLAAHKQDMVVLQNLQCKGAYGHTSMASLTGRDPDPDGATGISIDQRLAQEWEGLTPIPSLQLGVNVIKGAEARACSAWAGPHQPLPPENNPFAVFARLFPKGVGHSDAALERLVATRASILDNAKSESQALMNRVGTSDKQVLENYFDSLRDVEQQLADLRESVEACGSPTFPDAPAADNPWWLDNDRVPDVLDLHSDLITIAFQCDLTRVVTLNVSDDGGAYRRFPYIEGVPDGTDWHGISHWVETGNDDAMTKVDAWHMGKLAELLDRLAASTDADGSSVLSNSLVFSNNEYGPNGPVSFLPASDQNHSHRGTLMPYTLFGQAGGALKTGRNLVFPLVEGGEVYGWGIHSNRLLLSILHLFDLDDETFGDLEYDQGLLPELFV